MKYLMGIALGGVDLAGLDEKIYVEDIREEPETAMETAPRIGGGLFLTYLRRNSLKIVVKFMIKTRRRDERIDIIQKVFAWATEGYLTVSYRPGKRIYTRCTELPKVETWDWTQRLEVAFTAFGDAYWEDENPVSVSVSAAISSEANLFVPGNVDTYLEADITNESSSTMTILIIGGPNDQMMFTGIDVPAGHVITMTYDSSHILIIKTGSTSLLPYRAAYSSDDIILTANSTNQINLLANAECSAVFTARGMYR